MYFISMLCIIHYVLYTMRNESKIVGKKYQMHKLKNIKIMKEDKILCVVLLLFNFHVKKFETLYKNVCWQLSWSF